MEPIRIDHPCPCLGKGDFRKAKATYDDCVDRLNKRSPTRGTVAFRMPCCDSMNSASPRFYAEIFTRTTLAGKFLEIDSSVFQVFTADDPALPRGAGRPGGRFPAAVRRVSAQGTRVCELRGELSVSLRDRSALLGDAPPSPDDWQGFNLQRASQSDHDRAT